MTADTGELLRDLRRIVGRRHVITGAGATRRYRTGYRTGSGDALAVVRPGTLVEHWRVLAACISARVIVIHQAANTGLTGGSTPNGRYDRDVVIIATHRLSTVHLIDGGRQAVCLPGATLDLLERRLAPLGREPHSVIGSSCLGASVIGGVCNNSGGALVRRGPAYTEMALFARVDDDGGLQLVNHLDIALGTDPETILSRLESGAFAARDVGRGALGSDRDYVNRVRDIHADTPARFNADPNRLFEASGSAGRVAVFAVRLDTFARPPSTRTFYIGTNDTAALTELRKHILTKFRELPIAGEYMHRTAFDIAERYGKDSFLIIRALGTRRLPSLFAAKAIVDQLASRVALPAGLCDRALQRLSRIAPPHLPSRMTDFRDRFEHHLILKMAGAGIDEAVAYLASTFPTPTGDYFECTPREQDAAFLHRFAAAGAAVRYAQVHADCGGIIALDIALPRNSTDWFEELPDTLAAGIRYPLYYGHFFCHVFHQDYILASGANVDAIEDAMLERLDARKVRYPAEHNVGHCYDASPQQIDFYRKLDPTNMLNPGLGGSSKHAHWAE